MGTQDLGGDNCGKRTELGDQRHSLLHCGALPKNTSSTEKTCGRLREIFDFGKPSFFFWLFFFFLFFFFEHVHPLCEMTP